MSRKFLQKLFHAQAFFFIRAKLNWHDKELIEYCMRVDACAPNKVRASI